jgi:hypothetical protein
VRLAKKTKKQSASKGNEPPSSVDPPCWRDAPRPSSRSSGLCSGKAYIPSVPRGRQAPLPRRRHLREELRFLPLRLGCISGPPGRIPMAGLRLLAHEVDELLRRYVRDRRASLPSSSISSPDTSPSARSAPSCSSSSSSSLEESGMQHSVKPKMILRAVNHLRR